MASRRSSRTSSRSSSSARTSWRWPLPGAARQGNCYVASEALYHLLGGKEAGWTPMYMKWEGESHWFLRHRNGQIVDVTWRQFKKVPDYARARGCGFLTKQPSERARSLMSFLMWGV